MISDKEKLEYLWKHLLGVSQTSETKFPHNESIPSISPVFQNQIWSYSNKLPITAPNSIPSITPEWIDYMAIHKGNTAIQLKLNESSKEKTSWVAVDDINESLNDNNRLTDWIPPHFHISYRIQLYAGNPGQLDYQYIPFSLNEYEWEFDYNSGVLYWFNKVPPIALEKGLWIEGYRYIGDKGIGSSGSSGTGISQSIEDFNFVSNFLQPGTYQDFELNTGSSCILLNSNVSTSSTLECFTNINRVETNPYRFIGNPQQLFDDGSYVVGGQRYYGPRFVRLHNLDGLSIGKTYWRIWNNSSTTQQIIVNIQVLKIQ